MGVGGGCAASGCCFQVAVAVVGEGAVACGGVDGFDPAGKVAGCGGGDAFGVGDVGESAGFVVAVGGDVPFRVFGSEHVAAPVVCVVGFVASCVGAGGEVADGVVVEGGDVPFGVGDAGRESGVVVGECCAGAVGGG